MPPAPAAAAGQRDVERLRGEARSSFASASASRRAVSAASIFSLAALIARARGLPLLGGQLAERLQQRGQLAGLAEISRLGVLERGRVGRARRTRRAPARRSSRAFACRRSRRRKEKGSAPIASLVRSPALRREAGLGLLRRSSRNAALSVTARSASTLRSISIVGFLQAVHEHAVGHAVLAHRRVDAGDPQRAEHRASCCGGRGRRTAPPSSPLPWRCGRRCCGGRG